MNVFVSATRELDRALDALRDAGFKPAEDEQAFRARAREEGQFRGTIAGLRVDVFVPAIDYYADLEKRRRQVTLLGRSTWILAAEDLAVLKLMFFRRKDLADLEAMLRQLGSAIDRRFVRATLIGLVGADDERVVALDAVERDVDAAE